MSMRAGCERAHTDKALDNRAQTHVPDDEVAHSGRHQQSQGAAWMGRCSDNIASFFPEVEVICTHQILGQGALSEFEEAHFSARRANREIA